MLLVIYNSFFVIFKEHQLCYFSQVFGSQLISVYFKYKKIEKGTCKNYSKHVFHVSLHWTVHLNISKLFDHYDGTTPWNLVWIKKKGYISKVTTNLFFQTYKTLSYSSFLKNIFNKKRISSILEIRSWRKLTLY